MFIVANLAFGASIVVSDSLLNLSHRAGRDRVSSVGWAYGYAGGGLLLALNFGLVTFHDAVGLSTEMAVRISLLSGAVWWAAFTLIPVSRHPGQAAEGRGGRLRRAAVALASGSSWRRSRSCAAIR